MTDITDQDRRDARAWAEFRQIASHVGGWKEESLAAARYILATVEAPAPTLADEVRSLAKYNGDVAPWSFAAREVERLAARAEQIEEDLAEQVEATEDQKRHTARIAAERDEARAEVERITAVQKGAESNAETPDPADVKPGEAWIVEVDEERRNAVKDRDGHEPWNTVNADGWMLAENDEDITLVSRLVPAPRIITNPDELDRLAECAVIFSLSTKYALQRRDAGGEWYCMATRGKATSTEVLSCGPATVLWEPGA